ncbi:isocitrate lyase/phosphoenolpyruvate mutase family protein [Neorhizobium sp. P12A]|uniref:isocitrate lyase/PEP mutase family protein n=1 Tax=Neorhizobium sp. P12A TaxID=2268027 RepID=UPI0011EC3FB5|nr:isocitrate lyase/phosphoenolpyruvate mutase family protein [Neorhizobium sp. P12A]KAA0699866.1 isocitrate lyase/phosphoenolpyruvate mutase family protein [Neorhizobium sp. P12A]
MTQNEKARQFSALHVKGNPLQLFNAWDAGSAKAIAAAGAPAIATSSWAVAAALGYRDGEDLPLPLALETIGRVAAAVEIPVSADFEGGYSDDDATLAENVARLLDTGIVGINFEDRIVKGSGLYSRERQAERIAAIRKAADRRGVDLFINARTDLFFEHFKDAENFVDEAVDRARAYAEAGASSLFVPGLVDDRLIERVVKGSVLPVNVMVMDGVSTPDRLAALGVARISFGNIPYVEAMGALGAAAKQVYSS